MRTQTSITIRLDPAAVRALDAIVARDGGSRGRHVRQAVELLISDDNRQRLLRDAVTDMAGEVMNALRQEATLLLRGQIEAAKASDATSRQLVVDFIEVIGSASPVETKPAKATGHKLMDIKRSDV